MLATGNRMILNLGPLNLLLPRSCLSQPSRRRRLGSTNEALPASMSFVPATRPLRRHAPRQRFSALLAERATAMVRSPRLLGEQATTNINCKPVEPRGPGLAALALADAWSRWRSQASAVAGLTWGPIRWLSGVAMAAAPGGTVARCPDVRKQAKGHGIRRPGWRSPRPLGSRITRA